MSILEVNLAIAGLSSVMIRDFDGNISFWNPGAEVSYGYPKDQAIGQVSHSLLQTEFPEPLTRINQKLRRRRFWEGELIHTTRTGSKVRVKSRWELQRSPRTSREIVFEINRDFKPIFIDQKSWSYRLPVFKQLLIEKRRWWLSPIILLIALFLWVVYYIEVGPLYRPIE